MSSKPTDGVIILKESGKLPIFYGLIWLYPVLRLIVCCFHFFNMGLLYIISNMFHPKTIKLSFRSELFFFFFWVFLLETKNGFSSFILFIRPEEDRLGNSERSCVFYTIKYRLYFSWPSYHLKINKMSASFINCRNEVFMLLM